MTDLFSQLARKNQNLKLLLLTSKNTKNRLFEKLVNEPFWIWNIEQHKQAVIQNN